MTKKTKKREEERRVLKKLCLLTHSESGEERAEAGGEALKPGHALHERDEKRTCLLGEPARLLAGSPDSLCEPSQPGSLLVPVRDAQS